MNRYRVLVLLIAWSSQALPADSFSGRAKVVDGDSLEIAGQRVRLWGVDAPEADQICQRAAKPWKCGEAASRALRAHLAQRKVFCERLETDPHGRAVSRCKVAGKSLNAWLVEQGWALDYRRYSAGRFAKAENQARAARRGLWAGEFDTPERWRRITRR
ncbi:MAG: thermonuclease family protein [Panacagrimonas sp.]